MELNKLYCVAEKENIDVIDFKMKNKAIIGCIENNYSIGLNYSIIKDSSEEKTILAEELGHYYCNALYNSNYSNTEINKREFRATKWAFKTLVPYSKLQELREEGCKYNYEFAEELGVTEDLIKKAYNYYSEGNYG
ncbi:MAG: ImmA/IrrE family metallo-endopeptidase [Clostridia bacterium]